MKEEKKEKHEERNPKQKRIKEFLVIYKWTVPLVISIVVLVIILLLLKAFGKFEKEPKVTLKYMTNSEVASVVDVEQLATYRTIYNGIVGVYKEGKEETEENALYYVAYESYVTLGIDTYKHPISYEIKNPSEDDEYANIPDSKKKGIIVVHLPKIEVLDTTVEIGSLDFMFKNKSAKRDDAVVAEAYQVCIADAENEVAKKTEIGGLAKESCENTVRALMDPFLSQYKIKHHVDYELEIVWEE